VRVERRYRSRRIESFDLEIEARKCWRWKKMMLRSCVGSLRRIRKSLWAFGVATELLIQHAFGVCSWIGTITVTIANDDRRLTAIIE